MVDLKYHNMRTYVVICLALASGLVRAQVNTSDHWVEGYYRTDGTYVAGHYQTDPNGTVNDNYSTYPNVNPYTGEQGTRQRDYQQRDPDPNNSQLMNEWEQYQRQQQAQQQAEFERQQRELEYYQELSRQRAAQQNQNYGY